MNRQEVDLRLTIIAKGWPKVDLKLINDMRLTWND
jgi:hypothetical protein